MVLSSPERSGVRLLYVGPDEATAAPVVEALEAAGFTVDRVADSRQARDRVADRSLDCVVSEQSLPDGTGLELLRDIRRSDDTLPFVLFTGDGSERLASEAISAGVTDYVPRDDSEKQRGALVDSVAAAVEDGHREFAEVTEQLKDQAIDEAPVGITIADGRRRDTPLIYVNDAFEELTGYRQPEVLGRNCNFMQGDESSEAQIAEMARAIDEDEPVSVEIVNYTKGGEPFWNRVDIAPIEGESGEVTHYVGFQLDITDRVEAEREAKRQAEKATRERETVEALLDRLDGLVTDVTSRLLGADSREAVEKAVTGRLVETDEYAAAWVAERDPGSDTVSATTWAGIADPPGPVAADADDPVARAARANETQVVTDGLADRYAELVDGGVGGIAHLAHLIGFAIGLAFGTIESLVRSAIPGI